MTSYYLAFYKVFSRLCRHVVEGNAITEELFFLTSVDNCSLDAFLSKTVVISAPVFTFT